jgi:tryptophanyl-tRNA synthetase
VEFAAKTADSFYIVVDLHALTTIQDPKLLLEYRREAVLDLLACGFDPKKSVLFFQSDVPAHTELMWILATIAPMGLLERAVSYKEKVEKGIAASVGLFTYPVLMAADILLYDTNVVPVGKDQKQHLEMARDLALKFNNIFGETFVVPEPMIREESAVVPGVDGQKMSKSYGNTIPIFGSEKDVKKAIMGIVSDSKGMNDPKDPDTSVIFQIHKLFLSPAEQKALIAEYKNGLPYGDAKKKLLETYLDYFADMRKKREELLKDEGYVKEVMQEGAKKAGEVAERTILKVKRAVGLL